MTRAARPALLLAVGFLLYLPALTTPFLFDDEPAIPGNPSIRQLWSPKVFTDIPRETTVAGRPILNLSFAINYAMHGLRVEGYRITNVLIFLLSALTLFGILRRTFLTPRLRDRYGSRAASLACTIALLWLVHPLQTESVTYVVQRAESLMGLWYLLTLYAVIRGAGSATPMWWYLAGILSGWLGMGTKEVMVSAPVVVLLYDRTFLAGSFREAWQRRRWLYLGLALGWVWLGINLAGGPRPDTAGWDVAHRTWWMYALTQPGVLLHYLRLAFVPAPLVIDYADWPLVTSLRDAALPASAIVAALALTVWALRAHPATGLTGAWVWLILAPTSSVIPIADVAFEHRMHLPLAAILTLIVLAIEGGLRRVGAWTSRLRLKEALLAVIALAFGLLTLARNQDYRSEMVMWTDVTRKRPHNARAFNNLGVALAAQLQFGQAVACYEHAIRLNPAFADARYNLGVARFRQGRFEEAIAHYQEAIRLNPDDAQARHDLGIALQVLSAD